MHDLTLSNSLADLAARINAEHEAAGGKQALIDDLEEPFALSVAATAAIFDARDISLEMLRLVRNGEVVAS
jgi:hypothetical protein